ncbi:unnamed protein product [Meloidogyne enterolobii]|uniref:Uncharacterized protein n=1 Tax=Meloidogyne enterolobii TaxID=390850 RepID=A0ACB0ZQ51_MELEN
MITFLIYLLFLKFNLDGVLCQNISNNSLLTTNSISTTTTTIIATTTTQSTPHIASSPLPQLQLKIGLLGANASQYRSAYGFGQSVPAISIAIQRARSEQLIGFVNFTFTWLICDCDQILAVGYSNKLILDQTVDVIIGPPCVTSALDAALPPGFYSLPIFLWGATIATSLNDISIYPTVTNINTNTLFLAHAIEAILLQFQWYEVSLVYIPDDIRRVGYFFPQDFQTVVNANPNLTIVYNQQMAATNASMHNALTQIKNRSRIVIANIDNVSTRRDFLLAITDTGISQSNEYVFIFAQLRSLGMLQQITSNSNISKFDDFWKTPTGVDDGRDGDALKAARRTIIVDLENQSNSDIDAFNAKVVAEFGKPPFNCVNECMGGPNDQIPASYARSLHDTTYAYLRALNKTTEKFGYLTKDLARNGSLINNMSKGEFQGTVGYSIVAPRTLGGGPGFSNCFGAGCGVGEQSIVGERGS